MFRFYSGVWETVWLRPRTGERAGVRVWVLCLSKVFGVCNDGRGLVSGDQNHLGCGCFERVNRRVFVEF